MLKVVFEPSAMPQEENVIDSKIVVHFAHYKTLLCKVYLLIKIFLKVVINLLHIVKP